MQNYLHFYIRFFAVTVLLASTMPAGAQVVVDNGATLNITGATNIVAQGNIANNGILYGINGSLILNGATAQTISGNSIYFNNVTVNNNAGVTIVNGDTVKVYGIYMPTAGVLTANGYLLLASTASGTANVAQGTGTYVTGNAIVQRYIPAHRAWRFLTAPLSNSGAIFNNWQNNGAITDTSGVELWSPSGTGIASDGLLKGGGSASMEYFDPTVNNGSGGTWVGLTNTNTLLLDSTTASAGNKAFGVFVTGPYGSDKIAPATGDALTTLEATGQLQTGQQVFAYNNIPAGNYILIGNPYACPVNFTNVGATGAASGNINNVMWAWDAQRSGTSYGGYVTFSWDAKTGSYDQDIDPGQTAQTDTIQSGQAIFVQADTTTHITGTLENVAITFNETDKVIGINTNQVFGITLPTSQLRIALNRQQGAIMQPVDGILVKYNGSYKPGVSDDANKLYNYDENLALRISNNYLAIERKPLPVASDTLFLDIYALKKSTNYSFTIAPQNIILGEGIQPYLVDNYLNTKTPISFEANNTVSFSTTADAASSSETRFAIVFSSANALATVITNLKAAEVAKGIQVQWTSLTETGIKNYVVEKSADAINFAAGTSIKPVDNGNSQNYAWLDENPFSGDNYYRIQIVNNDGSINYSNVVLVKTGILSASFKAYPNPLPHSQQLRVDVGGVQAGKYTLQLFTSDGKKIIEKAIVSDGSPSTQLINLPTVATGVYQVILVDENGKTWKQQLEVN